MLLLSGNGFFKNSEYSDEGVPIVLYLHASNQRTIPEGQHRPTTFFTHNVGQIRIRQSCTRKVTDTHRMQCSDCFFCVNVQTVCITCTFQWSLTAVYADICPAHVILINTCDIDQHVLYQSTDTQAFRASGCSVSIISYLSLL